MGDETLAGRKVDDDGVIERAYINFLILANHVEAVNGLLYISGGGWNEHTRRFPQGNNPPPSHLGIGMSVAVPWNETNRQHTFSVRMEDEDAQLVVLQVDGQLNVGRPPNLEQGQTQYAMIGLPVDIMFPKAGAYRVVAKIGDGASTRWPFVVRDNPT